MTSIKTRKKKERNTYVVPSLFRKAGAHKRSQRKQDKDKKRVE